LFIYFIKSGTISFSYNKSHILLSGSNSIKFSIITNAFSAFFYSISFVTLSGSFASLIYISNALERSGSWLISLTTFGSLLNFSKYFKHSYYIFSSLFLLFKTFTIGSVTPLLYKAIKNSGWSFIRILDAFNASSKVSNSSSSISSSNNYSFKSSIRSGKNSIQSCL